MPTPKITRRAVEAAAHILERQHADRERLEGRDYTPGDRAEECWRDALEALTAAAPHMQNEA